MSDALAKLFEVECARSYEKGRQEATSISLGESSYGATRSALVAYEFKGLRDLIDAIRDRRWRRHGDNPGQAYMGTCELIHIHTTDWGKVALLVCAIHYDI